MYLPYGSLKGESPLVKDGLLFTSESHETVAGISYDALNDSELVIPEGVKTFDVDLRKLADQGMAIYKMVIPASVEKLYLNNKVTVKSVELSPKNTFYSVGSDLADLDTFGSVVDGDGNVCVKVTLALQTDKDGATYSEDGTILYSLPKDYAGEYVVKEGCVTIASSAFAGCTSLTDVVLPDSVTSIGSRAFEGCSSLKTISIPSQVKTIPSFCFADCSSLGSIVFSSGLTEIEGYAFQNCSNLANVDLPEGLITIGIGVYNGCSNLSMIDIPDSVKEIGVSAFRGTALQSFTIPSGFLLGTSKDDQSVEPMNPSTPLFYGGNPDEVGTDVVGAEPLDCTVSSIDFSKYQADYIAPFMFMGMPELEYVVIPSDIRSVMSGAFFGSANIKDVYVLSQNCDIESLGTQGSDISDFDIDIYPAFGKNVLTQNDSGEWEWVPQALSLNLYGLAYGDNPVISYAAENNSTFIPFVVLQTGVAASAELFGYEVTGYNNVKIADMVYTGEELTPQISVSFTDKANGGVADRVLTPGVDCSVTYKDAGGNTVTSIVAPGTYTAQIIGNDSRGVIGTQNVTFEVVDPSQQPAEDPNDNQNNQNNQNDQNNQGNQNNQQAANANGQQATQQAGYQTGATGTQQNASLAKTGDSADVTPVAAAAVVSVAAATLAGAVAARRKESARSLE